MSDCPKCLNVPGFDSHTCGIDAPSEPEWYGTPTETKASAELMMTESHLADVRRANRKLGEALREIFNNHGEDEHISKICNDAFSWVDI